MKKINLVIADNDLVYLKLITEYINNSQYKNDFTVKSFSDKRILIDFFKTKATVDILLATPYFLDEEIDITEITLVLIVDSQNPSFSTQHFFLYKYQPLNYLFSKILSFYFEKNEQTISHNAKNEETKIISVFSSTGGSGKSLVSINMAKQLSLNKKVFYLNLEAISSLGSIFELSSSYDLSRIIYYLKTDKAKLFSRIEGLKKIDSVSKIEYFEPVANSKELMELSIEDTTDLIDFLIKFYDYDYIVIDLDSFITDYVVGSLIKSNYIIWLLLDNIFNLSKTDIQLSQLRKLGNDNYFKNDSLYFVFNKYTGNIENVLPQGIEVKGYLPYVPEWKTITKVNQIYSNEHFNNQLFQIYNNFYKERLDEN